MINYLLTVLTFNCLIINSVYYFQLKSYFKIRYLKFYIKSKTSIFLLSICLLDILLNHFILKKYLIIYYIKNILLFIVIFIIYLSKNLKNKKIQLKFTFKIARIMLISNILALFYCFFINNYYYIYFPFIFVIFSDIFDIYKYIQNYHFRRSARKIIKTRKLIKIGITGSNGKTSVKNILYGLLSLDYDVVMTPKNFNTPKGIIYTITKTLTKNTDVIIFEMGARQKNDIKKLCKIACPNMGILTNISPQHLETFHTINNVYKTKNELSEYLKTDVCVYTYNNPLSFKSYLEKKGEKLLVGIIERKNKKLKHKKQVKIRKNIKLNLHINLAYKIDFLAKNIRVFNKLYHFDLIINKNKTHMATPLLGKHNILNILSAIAIATNLKINLKKIKEKLKHLSPIKHRLELIKGKIYILDDSYNCSLASAKNSLEVLAQFPNKRCVCTPGIIEGGKSQDFLNLELCKLIKANSDIQIFVGKTNKKTFLKVFKHEKSAYFVDTLNDAKKLFSLLLKERDSLLLLNDLPDDYR